MSTDITPVEAVCRTIKSPALQDQIKAALPENVSLDRFTRVTLTAIQQNPAICMADRQSLYNACVRCAADGLLPDGREAALVKFKTKQDGSWIEKVQYMPMVGGIIKRLAQAGIVIDAQLVYEGDTFEQLLGDDARITHRAPPLGQPRGNMIGAYAIAKLPNGLVMREVMDRDQIEQVRSVSRAKDDGPWVAWWGEMARKTVTRRLAKRLPILDANVRELLQADDDLYDLNPAPAQAVTPAEQADPQPATRPKALQAIVDQQAGTQAQAPTATNQDIDGVF